MFEPGVCAETVNVLRAILLGVPEGACIRLNVWTVLQLLVPFATIVIALQWVANRMIYGPGGKASKIDTDAPFRPKAGQIRSKRPRTAGD